VIWIGHVYQVFTPVPRGVQPGHVGSGRWRLWTGPYGLPTGPPLRDEDPPCADLAPTCHSIARPVM
jgi:hypothetical protein